jgi:hypothetical protein
MLQNKATKVLILESSTGKGGGPIGTLQFIDQ